MPVHLLRPRAIVGHLLVLAVVIGCVALGLWQLARLAEVRAINAHLEARLEPEPRDVDEVIAAATPPGATQPDSDALEFRRVRARGVYLTDEEVLQRNREHRTLSGFHVLTPLDLGDGRTLLVRRGWVPASFDEPPIDVAAPPDSPVEVTGVLEAPVPQPGFGPRDPDTGVLARVFHTDTARLDPQMSGTVLPTVLRLEEQAPSTNSDVLEALAPPVLDEANHRSYAVQWFIFATIALIAYVFWLRASMRAEPATGDEQQPQSRGRTNR